MRRRISGRVRTGSTLWLRLARQFEPATPLTIDAVFCTIPGAALRDALAPSQLLGR